MHFMDDRFVNLEEVILTFLWKSGTSDSATVCLVIRLSICYWLFKCRVLRVMCVWERETRSHNHGLCANTYELHHCVCHTTLFRSRAWTDGKTKDIINFFTLLLKAEARNYGKGSYISEMACGVRPIQGCPNYGPQAICGPRSFLWRPANDLKNNTNLALIWKNILNSLNNHRVLQSHAVNAVGQR